MFDLPVGVTWRNMLWAIPVIGFKPKLENSLRSSPVGGVGDSLGEAPVRIERQPLDMDKDLKAGASQVVADLVRIPSTLND